MLRLILGKAGAGKTAAVIGEIAERVANKKGDCMLLVPEQYSHEAERELCRCCGDSLSLYAEVFSFTGLSRRVMSIKGGAAADYLDKGGRLLCMALAVSNVSSRLRVYNGAAGRAEAQDMLLSALDELNAACVSPEMLFEAAEKSQGMLKDKLSDLGLIAESYEAVVNNGRADPAHRLDILAHQIEEGSWGSGTVLYVDGFIDFTNQELRVLGAFLKKGAELCVCMTVDELEGNNEIYELSRLSCRKLIAQAEQAGQTVRVEKMDSPQGKNQGISFYADHIFDYGEAEYQGESPNISLFAAGSMAEECELAAAKALELTRDKGLRWRDIAIAVRGFDDYRATLENTFRSYGVPLYTAGRSSLLQRPLPALISTAYEIIEGGWETDELISYMGTSLTGLSREECDLLSDYIFLWQLKSGAWHKKEDWQQHPEGFGKAESPESREALKKINELRRIIAEPLLTFQKNSELGHTAQAQAAALTELMAQLKLPEQLQLRADYLAAHGREELSQEYLQLWDITVGAIEQSAAVLGDMEMSAGEYGRLLQLMLSKYDVGSIPVSLDRVSAGDFDRMRRRSIKQLICLGCSDDRLPQAQEQGGVFSEDDKQRLLELDIDLGGGSELWREFSLIYNCMSLPSQGLTMSYAATGAEGEELRPAFPYKRAEAMFSIKPERVNMDAVRISAPSPALGLAGSSFHSKSPAAAAAAEYFKENRPLLYSRLKNAADMSRGKLSPAAVEKLYGKNPRLSASRIDKFSSCKFAYFCRYGLKAKPYEPAFFKPPEIGSFMHYVLEKTAADVKAAGGFKAVDDETLHSLAQKHVKNYISQELNDFKEKSRRFTYLFGRLCEDVHRIVQDMADELRRSDFEPMEFELDFSKAADIKPLDTGRGELSLTGIADRVDGWVNQGKLFLRVADYKTGRKKFSLSDVWYGMGLQMLLYLFTLSEGAEDKYGRELVPAGVFYIPARSTILSVPEEVSEAESEKKRADELRRSGLVLNDEAVLEAWENGEDKRYIPVKLKGRGENSLADIERMGALSRHIKKTLAEMSSELEAGEIAADPYYKNQQENACMNCEYYEICHFARGERGEDCRYMPGLSDKKVWSLLEGGEEDE